jgi:hypothetical protein
MIKEDKLFYDYQNDEDESLDSDKMEELTLEDELLIEDIENINEDDINFDEDLDEDNVKKEKKKVEDEIESDDLIYYRYYMNNHRLEGKHSLKRDTILKGKENLEETIEDEHYHIPDIDFDRNQGIEKGTDFEFESKHFMDYTERINLSKDVYSILEKNTNIDFKSNRRKPNRQNFNDYYSMLLEELSNKYSNYEIFIELSYYFTNNLFNMYKLLDKKYAMIIIKELQEKGYLYDLKKIKFV